MIRRLLILVPVLVVLAAGCASTPEGLIPIIDAARPDSAAVPIVDVDAGAADAVALPDAFVPAQPDGAVPQPDAPVPPPPDAASSKSSTW